jgi:hypothetical protein
MTPNTCTVAVGDMRESGTQAIFSEMTVTLADLTAQRHQLEHAARLAAEMAEVERSPTALEQASGPDLAALAAAAEEVRAAVAGADAAHAAACAEIEASRRRSPTSKPNCPSPAPAGAVVARALAKPTEAALQTAAAESEAHSTSCERQHAAHAGATNTRRPSARTIVTPAAFPPSPRRRRG